MHPQLVVFLAKEKNVVLENKSNHLVELKHSVDASDQEMPERIKLVKVFNYDFVVLPFYGMILPKHRQEMVKLQLLDISMRLAEFLIYFFYYTICYHFLKECSGIRMDMMLMVVLYCNNEISLMVHLLKRECD